jgi:hypothetical protein
MACVDVEGVTRSGQTASRCKRDGSLRGCAVCWEDEGSVSRGVEPMGRCVDGSYKNVDGGCGVVVWMLVDVIAAGMLYERDICQQRRERRISYRAHSVAQETKDRAHCLELRHQQGPRP